MTRIWESKGQQQTEKFPMRKLLAAVFLAPDSSEAYFSDSRQSLQQ
jgi:hypothetical protein